MLSSLCKRRNETIIPGLLSQHGAVLSGDTAVIDLSTAENWSVKEKLLPMVRGALENLSEEDLAYASGVGGCTETRKRMAELVNCHFRPAQNIDASHIVLAAGGSFALTALTDQICDPGDGILIATPYWAGLDIALSVHSRATVVPVHVPLEAFFRLESIDYYEEALRNSSTPIKAVLVCNPHNPLGQCYPRETLAALRDFCGRHGLHYISDEVYALSVHRPVPENTRSFVSALEFDQDGTQVHVIYSLSKDFGCNGIRLGALINQSNQVLRLSAALSVHSQVSSLSTALAYKSLLTLPTAESIVSYGGEKLKEAYGVILSFLEDRHMEFIPAQYGMFVFARLLPLDNAEAEERLQKSFKTRGVSISTGSSYHFNEAGWFRICYGMPLDDLRQGLQRIDSGIHEYLDAVHCEITPGE